MPNAITAAKRYARINGPRCLQLDKPKISRERITPEVQAQFDLFFSDKAKVSISSYKVDSKTNLPILYLQDDKQALWKNFQRHIQMV